MFTTQRDKPRWDNVFPGRLVVRPIGAVAHAEFTTTHSESFLQIPEWAAVKPGWRPENLGWFDLREDGEELVGVGLVLYRSVPGTSRSLAYLPEGPALPWAQVSRHPARWLDPLVAHLGQAGAFAVRIGPRLPLRSWQAATVKRGLIDPAVLRFGDLAPDQLDPEAEQLIHDLRRRGWRRADGDQGDGFGAGQPRIRMQLGLRDRSEAELMAASNQQWRRNVKRSAKAGVVVREGDSDDLPAFHRLYLETAQRDGFTPRPAGYFDGMWRALARGPEPHLRLYLAELGPQHEPLAAAITVQVGDVCWYSYGASTARHREVQGSTALQWHAIRAARDRGCGVYDLRGVADTLDLAQPVTGLVRFKLGLDAVCVETVGEWELTISPVWHKAFQLYLRARS
jgi:lipid II:glycine glycyltransferase (peptidoglycan interpeptide bridge formation enzyme)